MITVIKLSLMNQFIFNHELIFNKVHSMNKYLHESIVENYQNFYRKCKGYREWLSAKKYQTVLYCV